MSDWLDRINGTYGSNTVRSNAKTEGGRNISSTSTPSVRNVGNSDDDYVEVDFDDETVDNLDSEEHTYDELQTMYNNKESEIADTEGTLSDLQDNEKNGIHAAEEAYDEAVKNDEKVSQELRDKQAKNSEAITKKEDAISKKEKDISNYESEISDCGLNIEHLDAQMSKIQELLDMQPGTKTSQSDSEWEQIVANKSKYQAQISNLKRDIYLEKTKKSNLESKLKAAKGEKETLDGELEDLNKEKKEIDTEILKTCSEETKQLKVALDSVKSKVETDKSATQDKITTLRTELQEIANYMNNHVSLKVDNVSAEPVANAASVAHTLLGDEESMDYYTFNSKYGAEFEGMDGEHCFHDGQWCADTATYTMAKAYGGLENVPGNFNKDCPDEDKVHCTGLGRWAKKKDALMDKRNDSDNYDLSRVKQGDLILYNDSDDSVYPYTHVGMFDYIDDEGKIHTIEGNTLDLNHGKLGTHDDVTLDGHGNGISFILLSELEEKDRNSK